MATGLAVASLVLGVGSAVVQQRQAREIQREEERANAISNAQQSIARQRSIRQAIARSRVLRAEQEQAGFNTGFAGASPAIASDTASAIGAARTQQSAAFGVSSAANNISRIRSQPDLFGQFSNLAAGLSRLDFNQIFPSTGAGSTPQQPLTDDRLATNTPF